MQKRFRQSIAKMSSQDKDEQRSRQICDWANASLILHFQLSIPASSQLFFAQSMPIKLALSQAAWLSIFFRKISSVAPPWGTWIKDALLRGQRREKSLALNRIWTHDLSVTRRALYRCATTAAQQVQFQNSHFEIKVGQWKILYFLKNGGGWFLHFIIILRRPIKYWPGSATVPTRYFCY